MEDHVSLLVVIYTDVNVGDHDSMDYVVRWTQIHVHPVHVLMQVNKSFHLSFCVSHTVLVTLLVIQL